MTVKEFNERCEKELRDKEPKVYSKLKILKVAIIINGVLCGIGLLCGGTIGLVPAFVLLIIALVCGPATKEYDKQRLKYIKDNTYMNYPVNHPYSFIYPGETYPFSSVMATQPQVPTVQQAQPNVAPMQQPQVTLTNQSQNTPVYQPWNTSAQPVQQQMSPVQQPQVAQTAPVQAVVAKVEPTTKQIMCANCNQQLTIPVGNEPVMVTCPVCGNSFVHTPN